MEPVKQTVAKPTRPDPPTEPLAVTINLQPVTTFSIPNPPRGATSPEWIPQGQSVTVQGITIPGGLLYVGPKLKAANGSIEPALINPQLSIAKNVVDESERLMDYWPCYSQVSPKARRAYLQWLSHGRRSSDTNVGYVFLFFYGLERRALLELSPTDPEVTIIEAEVRRLLSIYGDNYSFRNYAQGFLNHLKNSRSAQAFRIPERPPAPSTGHFELPLELKYALGQFAAQGRPLDSAWARCWALSDPNINKRMPVIRCAEQFDILFAEKFARRYPEGLLVSKGKSRLRAVYQPASGGFRGQDLEIALGDLPDVTVNASLRESLQSLVHECSDALDPYSRYLGRNPGQEGSLEALLQLPPSLWPVQARSQLETVRDSLQDGRLSLSFAELAGKLNSAGALNKDKVMGLARALESVLVGMEPDVLGGAKVPKPEDRIVLFQSRAEDGQIRSNPSYHAAAVAIGLAYNVAMADGDFSQDEADFLAERIDQWPDLTPAQKLRLHAHLHMQKEQPISLATYKKKLEPLPQPARATIGKFLAHLAQADGVVSPSEVKLLEKLYKTLGLDPKTVFGDLHKAPPATVKASTPGFALDLDRIAELKKETEQVTAILREVFAEEEVDKPEPEPVPSGLLGLDNDHSLFLRLLFSRASWSRQEVEDAASDMGLMTDGALEQINEASFDKFSEVLLEGEDPLEINPQVMEMVLA
ncbi:TerB N-terminal domain-containing protein [bacterium]|nr:TerB N-terminal domain-containing protein [bacterium]